MNRPMPKALADCGDFFFKHRNLLFPVIFLAAFAAFPPAAPESRADAFASIAGVALAVAGQGYRLLVIGYEYIKRGGKDGKVFADKLVTGGFYACSRNPMYLGNILVVAGVCAIHGSWAATAILLPLLCFIYAVITAAEERYLAGHFGADYDDYCTRVNRFVPDFRGIGRTIGGYAYDWKRAIRKDYGNVFTNFTLVIVILAWKWGTTVPGAWIEALTAFAALAAFWAAARAMKKTGRLASPN